MGIDLKRLIRVRDALKSLDSDGEGIDKNFFFTPRAGSNGVERPRCEEKINAYKAACAVYEGGWL